MCCHWAAVVRALVHFGSREDQLLITTLSSTSHCTIAPVLMLTLQRQGKSFHLSHPHKDSCYTPPPAQKSPPKNLPSPVLSFHPPPLPSTHPHPPFSCKEWEAFDLFSLHLLAVVFFPCPTSFALFPTQSAVNPFSALHQALTCQLLCLRMNVNPLLVMGNLLHQGQEVH